MFFRKFYVSLDKWEANKKREEGRLKKEERKEEGREVEKEKEWKEYV